MTDTQRIVFSSLLAFLWLLFTLWCLRKRLYQAAPTLRDGGQDIVAYASQGGRSLVLAEHLINLLQTDHQPQLLCLNDLNDKILSNARRLFLIVSTYGEGEPPDNGALFHKRYMRTAKKVKLHGCEFAVLALGDRSYTHFCVFGQALQQSLLQWGAEPMSELTKLEPFQTHNHDQVLRNWLQDQPKVSLAYDVEPFRTQIATDNFSYLQLSEQTCINPGSPGAPLFQISASYIGPVPNWLPGDTLEIQPCNSEERIRQWLQAQQLDGKQWLSIDGVGHTLSVWLSDRQLLAPENSSDVITAAQWLDDLSKLPSREYSIASLHEEACIRLLVRQEQDQQTGLGLGSGWLTAHAAQGTFLRGRIRSNPGFHPPPTMSPLILIGAGSGLAGLRGHIAHRAAAGQSGLCWLCYGERSPQYDQIWLEELTYCLSSKVLSELSLSYSRDADNPRYVQDLLEENSEMLRQWVDDQAYIYVCGKLSGMGNAVDMIMQKVLGQEKVQLLKESGRYCRELY